MREVIEIGCPTLATWQTTDRSHGQKTTSKLKRWMKTRTRPSSVIMDWNHQTSSRQRWLQRRGCAAPRSTKVFFMSKPMSIHLEMGVVRERGASLNRSGVKCGIRRFEKRNGMFWWVLQSGAALKAVVGGESARSARGCTVWDGLEVHTLSSNRHSVPLYHCHQCSSNWNHQTVDVTLSVLLLDGTLCRRSRSLLLLRVVRWWQSTTCHRAELCMLSHCLCSTFSTS